MNNSLSQTKRWVAHRAPVLMCWVVASPVLLVCNQAASAAAPSAPPNVIVILTDDEGYGDLKSFYPATGVGG